MDLDGLKELGDVREAIQNDPHPDSADTSHRHTGALSATGAPVADTKGQISWAMFQWARDPYVIGNHYPEFHFERGGNS